MFQNITVNKKKSKLIAWDLKSSAGNYCILEVYKHLGVEFPAPVQFYYNFQLVPLNSKLFSMRSTVESFISSHGHVFLS